MLKEYKGKLYVTEQIFGTPLSEEEEFNANLKTLPKMSVEDFTKALSKDKIKRVTSKEDYGFRYRDYIVDLKEIPADQRLQATKWWKKNGSWCFCLIISWGFYRLCSMYIVVLLLIVCVKFCRVLRVDSSEDRAILEEYYLFVILKKN